MPQGWLEQQKQRRLSNYERLRQSHQRRIDQGYRQGGPDSIPWTPMKDRRRGYPSYTPKRIPTDADDALYTPPLDQSQTMRQMPNYDKLRPFERYLTEDFLPGFAESSAGKALARFSEGWAGKALGYIDVLAEGLERGVGFAAQLVNAADDPEELDSIMKDWKSAWYAGSLFSENVNLPSIIWDEQPVTEAQPGLLEDIKEGIAIGMGRAGREQTEFEKNFRPVGITLPNDLPGTANLANIRKAIAGGMPLEEARAAHLEGLGALAIRAQMHDTYFHMFGDPLNYIMPQLSLVERANAARYAITSAGKVTEAGLDAMRLAEDAAKAAGKLDEAAMWANRIANSELVTTSDRIIMAITGGDPLVIPTTPLHKLQRSRLNLFALTPEARAHELMVMVADHVDAHILKKFAEPEDIVGAINRAMNGALGPEFGHAFLNIEGRSAQAVLSGFDVHARDMLDKWTATVKQRQQLDNIAKTLNISSDKLLNEILEGGDDVVRAMARNAGVDEKILKDLGKLFKDQPHSREVFNIMLRNKLLDHVEEQGVLMFGVKQRGFFQKAAQTLKAAETMAFLRLNPGYAIRNFVNNEFTMLARGLVGRMTGETIEALWDRVGFTPLRLSEGFSPAGLDIDLTTRMGKQLVRQPGAIYEALRGERGLMDRFQDFVSGINLGKVDMGKAAAYIEQRASNQAMTDGFLQGMRKYYWKPGVGYDYAEDWLRRSTVDWLKAERPEVIQSLQKAIGSALSDAEIDQFARGNLNLNIRSILDDASEQAGFDIGQVLKEDFVAKHEPGLLKAAEEGPTAVRQYMVDVRKDLQDNLNELIDIEAIQVADEVAAKMVAEGPKALMTKIGDEVDRMWGTHIAYASQMERLEARITKGLNREQANILWNSIKEENFNKFDRMWKSFDSVLEGIERGAKQAGFEIDPEIRTTFRMLKQETQDFFKTRNAMQDEFFAAMANKQKPPKTWGQITSELDDMYREMIDVEDVLMKSVDDKVLAMFPEDELRPLFETWRRKARELRRIDRERVVEFRKELAGAERGEIDARWQQFWSERYDTWNKMAENDRAGFAMMTMNTDAMDMFAAMQDDWARFADLPAMLDDPNFAGVSDNLAEEFIQNYATPTEQKMLEDLRLEIAQFRSRGQYASSITEQEQFAIDLAAKQREWNSAIKRIHGRASGDFLQPEIKTYQDMVSDVFGHDNQVRKLGGIFGIDTRLPKDGGPGDGPLLNAINKHLPGRLADDVTPSPRGFVGDEFLPEGQAEGMWHVTTAKDKVAKEGLRPRSETGAVALGGGIDNQAPNLISVTFDEGAAMAISERLNIAARAARDEVTIDEIVDAFDYIDNFVDDPMLLNDAVSKGTYVGRPIEDLDEWVEVLKNSYYGGQGKYQLVQALDDAIPKLFDNPFDSGYYRVGLTASYDDMLKIDPDQIEILSIGAKKAAKPEHIADEFEFRFDPKDIQVITGDEAMPAASLADVTLDDAVEALTARAKEKGLTLPELPKDKKGRVQSVLDRLEAEAKRFEYDLTDEAQVAEWDKKVTVFLDRLASAKNKQEMSFVDKGSAEAYYEAFTDLRDRASGLRRGAQVEGQQELEGVHTLSATGEEIPTGKRGYFEIEPGKGKGRFKTVYYEKDYVSKELQKLIDKNGRDAINNALDALIADRPVRVVGDRLSNLAFAMMQDDPRYLMAIGDEKAVYDWLIDYTRYNDDLTKAFPNDYQKFYDILAKDPDELGRAARVRGTGEYPGVPDMEDIQPSLPPKDTVQDEFWAQRGFTALDYLEEGVLNQMKKPPLRWDDLPKEVVDDIENYLLHVKGQLSDATYASTRFAEFKRDSALLNYNRRYNYNTYLGMIAPYEFWFTQSLGKWALHSIDRPAMISSYLRIKKLLETSGAPNQKLPSRLRGKPRISLPWAPEWMQNRMFVDPLRLMLPFDQFAYGYEQYQKTQSTLEGRAQRLLEEKIDQGEVLNVDEARDAIRYHSGPVWEEAITEAQMDDENLKQDAWDFMKMLTPPHAPLIWAIEKARGTPENIMPFTPLSRTAKGVAGLLGIDWNNHPWNLEAKLRKQMGLPAFDKWDDYRVDRMLSNMAGDQEITVEEALQAMREREGEIFEEATRRAGQEFGVAAVGSSIGLPMQAYPTGEHKQRNLADEFDRAYKKYYSGDDPEALDNFYEKHPEYESRLALFKKPEERLQSFLVDEMWDKWNQLSPINKREVSEQLGKEFEEKFLQRETRSYESIDLGTMQVWLKLISGEPPGTLTASVSELDLTDPDMAWRAQVFKDSRKQYFPDWYDQQKTYFELKKGKARSKYLKDHPELAQYWDWRRDWFKNNPDVVPYLSDTFEFDYKSEEERAQAYATQPNYTWEEWQRYLSRPMLVLLTSYWRTGERKEGMDAELEEVADQFGVDSEQILDNIMNSMEGAWAQ